LAQSVISRVFVGPYGLHAVGALALAIFVAFLWTFNFTSFF
jgi:hypothetical protein